MPGERMDTLRTPGIGRGEPVSIFVNGEETRAFEGETVLAALWAVGERTLHTTARTQEPRGYSTTPPREPPSTSRFRPVNNSNPRVVRDRP